MWKEELEIMLGKRKIIVHTGENQMTKRMNRRNKGLISLMMVVALLIGIVMATSLLFSGCMTQRDNSGTVYTDFQSQIYGIEKAEEERISTLRRSSTGKFSDNYHDGMFFEDFSVEKEMINEELVRFIEGQIDNVEDIDYIMRPNLECFNTTYKKVREESLDIEQIMSDPVQYVKEYEMDVYLFVTNMYDDSALKLSGYFSEQSRANKGVGFKDFKFRVYEFGRQYLESISVDELKDNENILEKLIFSNDYDISSYFANGDGYGGYYNRENFEEYTKPLEEKFKEKFVIIDQTEQDEYGYLCAPVSNLNLLFQATKSRNRYSAVLTQSIMTEEIEKIIRESGAEGRIVQFTSSGAYDDLETNENSIINNVSDRSDNRTFLKEVNCGYTTSLYYLKSPSEAIDYELLMNLSKKISEIRGNEGKHTLMIYPYNTGEEVRKILVELFKKNEGPDKYFKKPAGANLLGSVYKTRDSSEKFKYLDMYGSKLDHMFFIYRVDDEFFDDETKEDVDRFIERYKKRSIWVD